LRRKAVELAVDAGGFLRIRGGCMRGIAPAGAAVRVEVCALSGLCPGDVVLIARGGVFFLHRFLRMVSVDGELRLLTKGDSARRPDRPCRPECLLGRLTEVRADGLVRRYRPSLCQRVWAAFSGLAWWLVMLLRAAWRREAVQ
jgi:hypothetical protein